MKKEKKYNLFINNIDFHCSNTFEEIYFYLSYYNIFDYSNVRIIEIKESDIGLLDYLRNTDLILDIAYSYDRLPGGAYL